MVRARTASQPYRCFCTDREIVLASICAFDNAWQRGQTLCHACIFHVIHFGDHPRMTHLSPTGISSGSNRHWVFNILNAPFRTWSRTWALLHLLLFCFQTFWSIGLMNHSCTLTMAPSTLNLPTGSMTAISSARALNSLLTNLSSVRDQCDLWLYSDAYCVTLGLLGCLAFPLNTRGTWLARFLHSDTLTINSFLSLGLRSCEHLLCHWWVQRRCRSWGRNPGPRHRDGRP